MENQNNESSMSTEQSADLAALQAAAADGEPPMIPGESPAVAAGPDQSEQWALLPAMVGSALQIAMPELGAVYTPEACRAWGAAMVPVAEKYGWNADALGGPEIGLAVASFPLVIGTVQAVRAFREKQEFAAMKHRADAAAHFAISRGLEGAPGEPAAPIAPDMGKTVQFGTAQ